MESGLPHVNSVGGEMSGRFGLVRGKAWNQTGQDCYEIASAVAARFGVFSVPFGVEVDFAMRVADQNAI